MSSEEKVVHGLVHGYTPCGMLNIGVWFDGHSWVTTTIPEGLADITCESCRFMLGTLREERQFKPGLHLHYKNKKYYRALVVTRYCAADVLLPDESVVVFIDRFFEKRHSYALPRLVFNLAPERTIVTAKSSSNDPIRVVNGETIELVVYVALYDDGRVSVRPKSEFMEIITLEDGSLVPRFARVGP